MKEKFNCCCSFENEFNAAIMLCEGGFPLMETDEMNFGMLIIAEK